MYNTWPIAITMNAAGYVANTACCVSPLLSALSAKSAERNTSGHGTTGRLMHGCGSFMGLYTGASEDLAGGLSDRRTPMAWSQGDTQPVRQDQRPEISGFLQPEQNTLGSADKLGGGDLAR